MRIASNDDQVYARHDTLQEEVNAAATLDTSMHEPVEGLLYCHWLEPLILGMIYWVVATLSRVQKNKFLYSIAIR
jgi:hypothetical protein